MLMGACVQSPARGVTLRLGVTLQMIQNARVPSSPTWKALFSRTLWGTIFGSSGIITVTAGF
jgi:hypothetical protein